jgi:hypothetical protein
VPLSLSARSFDLHRAFPVCRQAGEQYFVVFARYGCTENGQPQISHFLLTQTVFVGIFSLFYGLIYGLVDGVEWPFIGDDDILSKVALSACLWYGRSAIVWISDGWRICR